MGYVIASVSEAIQTLIVNTGLLRHSLRSFLAMTYDLVLLHRYAVLNDVIHDLDKFVINTYILNNSNGIAFNGMAII
ncbi:MAG: hypothetical protein LBH30_00260 [Prevotellaceae bacterium]|nr:hypothetical protein [Prevotellaceae bacterium]